MFDQMPSHHISSDRVLSMVVERAIYPIKVDVLNLLFASYGVEQLELYPPTTSEDGEACVAADVRFSSAHAAAQALAYWDGHCIYYRCCRLQMWYATLDVLPAPASPSPTLVKGNRDTATAFGPEPVVDLNNSTAAISGHDGKSVGDVNIPEAASTSTPPHVHDTSPKSSLDSDCSVPVAGTDEYTLVAAIPEVVTELAFFPGVPSTIEAQEVLHDASVNCIDVKPMTCSTECSNQDNNTLAFPTPVMTVSLLPTATPTLVTDLVHSGTDAVDSIQPFRNHDLDVSPPTRHARLLIRATPWPSFLVEHIAEGNEIRPTPWPSFPIGVPSIHKDALQVFEPMTRLFDKPEDTAADVKDQKDDAKLSLLFEENMRSINSELRLTWPPLVGANFGELCSLRQFDSDGTLSLFPRNLGGYLLKHRNQMTMVLSTASSGSHWHVKCVIKESSRRFSQTKKVQWLFPICLKTTTQCLLILPLAHLDYEPWSPPLHVWIIRHKGHLFSPRPWSSFKCHSEPDYPEPCSIWSDCHLAAILNLRADGIRDRQIFTVQSASTAMKMQATRMLCITRPPARPSEDYDKCIPLFIRMQALASYPSCVVTKFKPLFEMPCLLVQGNCDAMSDSSTLPLHAHLGSFSVLKWYLQIIFNYIAAPWGQCNCAHLQPWISSTEVFQVSFVELQSWPSEQLSIMNSIELANCCSEMIHHCAHAGANRMELSTQSVFFSSYEQFQLEIAWPLSSERNTTTVLPCCMHSFQFSFREIRPWFSTGIWGFNAIYASYVFDGEQIHTSISWSSFQPASNAKCSTCTIISRLQSKSDDPRNAILSTMDYVILHLDQSGAVSWDLPQMTLSTLKNSTNSTQAELSNGFKCSDQSLRLSIAGTKIESRSTMFSIFGESLSHLYGVLLLLPWPPNAHGLQSTIMFMRLEFKCEFVSMAHWNLCLSCEQHLIKCPSDISCPFSTLAIWMQKCSQKIDMLPCFPSGPISGEADHSGWYLALLRLLAVQTVNIAAATCDSKSSTFASVVLLVKHKQPVSKDLTFLSVKSSRSGLLLVNSTQHNFSVFAMRRNCHLHMLPALDYTSCCLCYWLDSGYTFVIEDVRECGMSTFKLGILWDPGGLLLVVLSQASSPGLKHGASALKTAIMRIAVVMGPGGNNTVIDLALLPWDPGGITHELEKSRHWLEGKPVVKEGGVSVAFYSSGTGPIIMGQPPWAWPIWTTTYTEGRGTSRGIRVGSRQKRRRLLSLPLPAVLPLFFVSL